MTISIKEIHDNIENMGYITATPRKLLEPSFYKLPDGSILSLLIRVNHLVIDHFKQDEVTINSVINLHVFVEKTKRQLPTEPSIHPNSLSMLDDDVECITLREEFNVYDLSNGDVLRVKSVIGQVRKLNGFSTHGESIYDVDSQPVVRIKRKSN